VKQSPLTVEKPSPEARVAATMTGMVVVVDLRAAGEFGGFYSDGGG